jgi:hypothetical protein
MNKMNKYKAKLLRKEFPFIERVSELVKVCDWQSIRIQKADYSLLSRSGFYESYDGCKASYRNEVQYFVVTKDIVIGLDQPKTVTMGLRSFSTGANPIDEQLFTRKLNPPEFIVEVKINLSEDDDGEKTEAFLIIHKMKRLDLDLHHQEQIDKAATELKAEIAVICS